MEMPEVVPVVTPPSPPTDHPQEEIPPAAVAGGIPLDNDEFQRRVMVVMAAIEDPEKYRRCIAEIHTYLSMFEQGFREMQQEMIANGGPMAMIRKMMFGGR